MGFEEKLGIVLARHEELEALLGSGDNIDGEAFVKMSKELSSLKEIVPAIEEYQKAQKDMLSAREMMDEAGDDAEMRAMAQEEFYALKEKMPSLEQNLKILLLPKDAVDDKNAILEVRAGTGGEEAALFAAELFRMYEHYAAEMGWKFEPMEISETGIGGYKEASAGISGKSVFERLKFESGVHRVQRVPETESGGRVHTSAATVAVLPEAEDVDLKIDEKDLKIDVYRASGAGGQHVNRTESAVRITHIPTGFVVACQDERSQFKNKDRAMRILRSRLYDFQRQKLDSERAGARKQQVGSGDRSERIRTYNFPQGRVTDHRINLTLYKIDAVMNGAALDEIIEALITEDRLSRLSELD